MNQTSRQEGGHICEPEWFHNKVKTSDDKETEDTLEILKAKADHDYAKHNFVQAGDLYGQILDLPQINMPLFREACEGRVRCLIKDPTQNQDEAQNLAIQLLQKSNPANQGNLLRVLTTKPLEDKEFEGCILSLHFFSSQFKTVYKGEKMHLQPSLIL